MVMDEKVRAVIDIYHERIREEHQGRRMGPPPQRGGGDFRGQAFLAVGPDTGQLINTIARSLKAPNIVEIGTSFGYSGIWLAEAARAAGGCVTTMEIEEHKAAYAEEMAIKAGLADFIDFKFGDALKLIDEISFKIDFVLLDLWKDMYVPCLDAFYPKLNPGAIIVADNMIRPGGPDIARYAQAVRAKPKMSSILLPVGSGVEVSVYGS
jgi:predicted O-methyltransferase YrrM